MSNPRSDRLPACVAGRGNRAVAVAFLVLLLGAPGCWDSAGSREGDDPSRPVSRPLVPEAWNQAGIDPQPVMGGGEWVSVYADFRYTCGIRTDASLWCWGQHRSGRIGDGAAADRDVPVSVAQDADWRTVALADFLTCGLEGESIHRLRLWCWGSQDEGVVSQEYPAPTSVSPRKELLSSRSWWGLRKDLKLSDIAIGDAHSCALTVDGKVYCAGGGPERMGSGACPPFAGTWCPVDVSLVTDASPFTALAVGSKHSLAVTQDGLLYGWGGNHRGQVGHGSVGGDVPRPVPVSLDSLPGRPSVQQVAAGTFHSCALWSGGLLACWGSNDTGCLGLGDTTDRDRPTPVRMEGVLSGRGVVQVDAGFNFTCAVSSDGNVICWGANYCSHAVHGNMDRTACSPVFVAGPALGHPVAFRQVSCGCTHACAVDARNEIYCWGAGKGPWLGRGPDREDESSPR